MSTAFITGADRGLGLAMTSYLAEKGWRVFAGSYLPDWPELSELAGRYPELITIIDIDIASDQSVQSAKEKVSTYTNQIDMIINNAAVSSALKDRGIREQQDDNELMRLYDVNSLGALRVVQVFLPLMSSSDMKRLCFVSSEAGSINRCERRAWYGYCMSKAALNRGVQLLFAALRPEGYTFRLFHPGWMRTYMSGVKNTEGELEAEEVAPSALLYFMIPRGTSDTGISGEDRLVMRDWKGREWAF